MPLLEVQVESDGVTSRDLLVDGTEGAKQGRSFSRPRSQLNRESAYRRNHLRTGDVPLSIDCMHV